MPRNEHRPVNQSHEALNDATLPFEIDDEADEDYIKYRKQERQSEAHELERNMRASVPFFFQK